ncbi:MAG TPA: hypothetical protein VEP90_19845 [Methylomirabilota bacterium]|nr:hypothetical protein [Methylomirabilota bacterium]
MKDKNNLYGILFYGIIALLAIYFLFFRHNQTYFNGVNITPSPTEDVYAPTSNPLNCPNCVTQSYWYCWDNGTPGHHHFGHHVYGDHFCTNQELGR